MTKMLVPAAVLGCSFAFALSFLPVRSRGLEAFAPHDYKLREEHSISRTLRFGGTDTRTVDVRIVNGSIRVTADGGSDVRVEAKQTIAADTDEGLRAGQREAVLETNDNTPTIEVLVREVDRLSCGEWSNGNTRSRAWWDRRRYEVTYDLTIRVPRATRLRLCTINGSDIYAAGTTGDFDVSNVNGRITMENMRGAGRANTVNGPVTVSFEESPKAESLFKTVNGDVAVTFPAGLAADLKMKTFNGGLFTDFEVTTLPLALTSDRRNGRSVYRSNRFSTFRVGSGGPELTFETLNGDVRILRRAK